jgi:two-component system, OmpR family, KDP operon response regulator KdpE
VALVRSEQFDAVLLDINMPGIGGIEVCRIMRKVSPRLPIVMLTVQGSEDRKVEALNAGADDYITKPFQLRELTARLRAAVRRNRLTDDQNAAILIGDILLDPGRHLVEKKGRGVHLTPKQFELLNYLMAHAGRPIPHAKLLRSVWGPEYGNELEYLRTYIRQIRMKIEDDPADPRYLLTDSHIGYRFSESA